MRPAATSSRSSSTHSSPPNWSAPASRTFCIRLRGVEIFDTPGAGREDLVADDVVVHELPVGYDDAVVTELIAKQARDDLAVVAEADLFDGFTVDDEPDRHAVVRHHRGGVVLDRRPERREVLGEPATWVDLLAAVREVRVLAVLLRSAAGEVFRRARDAVGSERVALHPVEVGGDQGGRQLEVSAESVDLAAPAWFGREVDGRVQRGADPDGGVLLPGDAGEFGDRADVVDRSEPNGFGPLRERGGGEGGAGVLDEAVPRVGGHGDGDAVRGLLGDHLHGVVPACGHPGVGEGVDVEVVDELADDHGGGAGFADLPGCLEDGAVGAGLDDGVEHQPDPLGERELAEQVVDALTDAQFRVLVGIHDAVAVEVAVGDALGAGRGGGLHGRPHRLDDGVNSDTLGRRPRRRNADLRLERGRWQQSESRRACGHPRDRQVHGVRVLDRTGCRHPEAQVVPRVDNVRQLDESRDRAVGLLLVPEHECVSSLGCPPLRFGSNPRSRPRFQRQSRQRRRWCRPSVQAPPRPRRRAPTPCRR